MTIFAPVSSSMRIIFLPSLPINWPTQSFGIIV
jgi:hypothetical protein